MLTKCMCWNIIKYMRLILNVLFSAQDYKQVCNTCILGNYKKNCMPIQRSIAKMMLTPIGKGSKYSAVMLLVNFFS